MVFSSDLKEKAFNAALDAESKYGGCAQCVIAGLMETIGGIPKDVYKAASALGAGIDRQGETCGALTGSLMVLSYLYGREYDDCGNMETKERAFQIGYKMIDRYREKYGSIRCKEVQAKMLGRSFKMYDPEDFQAFMDAGGHDVEHCPTLCGQVASWVVEILEEEGYFADK